MASVTYRRSRREKPVTVLPRPEEIGISIWCSENVYRIISRKTKRRRRRKKALKKSKIGVKCEAKWKSVHLTYVYRESWLMACNNVCTVKYQYLMIFPDYVFSTCDWNIGCYDQYHHWERREVFYHPDNRREMTAAIRRIEKRGEAEEKLLEGITSWEKWYGRENEIWRLKANAIISASLYTVKAEKPDLLSEKRENDCERREICL